MLIINGDCDLSDLVDITRPSAYKRLECLVVGIYPFSALDFVTIN